MIKHLAVAVLPVAPSLLLEPAERGAPGRTTSRTTEATSRHNSPGSSASARPEFAG